MEGRVVGEKRCDDLRMGNREAEYCMDRSPGAGQQVWSGDSETAAW